MNWNTPVAGRIAPSGVLGSAKSSCNALRDRSAAAEHRPWVQGLRCSAPCLARLSSSAAQYGDAILGGSRLGHELADFAVEGKRTLRVVGGRIRRRFFARRS